jgi:hypothetical protein
VNDGVCDKYYIAQNRKDAAELGWGVPHFCYLEKGHNGHHICPGGRMHTSEEGGIHKAQLHFELQGSPASRSMRIISSKSLQ